jgi:hypothetical protein
MSGEKPMSLVCSNIYDRKNVVNYALNYGKHPNPSYTYFHGNDCTNFVSQCLHAGGVQNHFHPTHPWWYKNGKASICWSVAASLYWYIKICTEQNDFGIKAQTISIKGDTNYNSSISEVLEVGDLIQYRNDENRIQHTAIISGFSLGSYGLEPLICQHTFEAVNIPWKKGFKETIFHHIQSIN